MLDAPLRRLLGPALERGGALLARSPLTADQMTLAGVILALLAALAIVAQAYLWGLALLLLSRLADGLDGPIARAKGSAGSAWGGYLDSVADYVFYAAIPLAFALADPERNAVWAALLLAAFLGTCSSFLGFAVIAEKLGWRTESQGKKSFYYAAGLAEGSETIGFFVLFCLFPGAFPWLAGLFTVICLVTTWGRVQTTRARLLKEEPRRGS